MCTAYCLKITLKVLVLVLKKVVSYLFLVVLLYRFGTNINRTISENIQFGMGLFFKKKIRCFPGIIVK